MNGLVVGYDTEEESGDEGHVQQQQQPKPGGGGGGGGLLGQSYARDEEEDEEGALGPLQGPAMPPPGLGSASPTVAGTADTRGSYGGNEPWRSPLPPGDAHRQPHQRAVPISPVPPPLGEAGATYYKAHAHANSAALDIEGMAVGDDDEGGGGGRGEEPLDTTYFDQLPPEPEEECPPELQQRVIDFLSAYAEAGSGSGGRTGFTENLKQKKDFGNPELLQRVIEVFGIDQHSSNYPAQLFDPHGYAPEDYIDQIRALQRQLEMEAISGSQARMTVGVPPSSLPPLHPAGVAILGMPSGAGAAGGAGGPPPLPPGAASALQRAQAAAAAMGVGPGAAGGRASKWGAAPGAAGAGAGAGAAGAGAGAAGASSGSELVQGALAALQARWQQQGGSRPPSQTASPHVALHTSREGSSGGSSGGEVQGQGLAQGRRSKFSDLPPR